MRYLLQGGKLRAVYDWTRELYANEHNPINWVGKAADQSGDIWTEREGLTPFRAISGNGIYGSEIKVIGPGDLSVDPRVKKGFLTKVLIVDYDQATPYYIRFIWGLGTVGEAEAAGQYTIFSFLGPAAPKQLGGPVAAQMPPLPPGTKSWAKTKNVTNLAYIDFLAGGLAYLF